MSSSSAAATATMDCVARCAVRQGQIGGEMPPIAATALSQRRIAARSRQRRRGRRRVRPGCPPHASFAADKHVKEVAVAEMRSAGLKPRTSAAALNPIRPHLRPARRHGDRNRLRSGEGPPPVAGCRICRCRAGARCVVIELMMTSLPAMLRWRHCPRAPADRLGHPRRPRCQQNRCRNGCRRRKRKAKEGSPGPARRACV